MRAVIEGTSVKTVSGERARLEIAEHSGEIFDHTVDQRRLARKFSYKTGDGQLEALEVFHIEDISRARLELLLSVWIRDLWLRYRPVRSAKRKIWYACKNRLGLGRSNKGVPVQDPWMFNRY